MGSGPPACGSRGGKIFRALGYVTVAAPREQSKAPGAGLPLSSDGVINPQIVTVHGKEWTVYAVGIYGD